MSKMPTVLCVVVAVSCATMSLAAETTLILQQPLGVRPASYEYGDLFAAAPAAESPSAPPPAPKTAAPAAPAADEGYARCAAAACADDGRGCDPFCDAACGGGGCDGWTLPQPCFLQRMGITAGGWLQQGFTANPDRPDNRWNGPLALNDRSNDYEMNQLWFYLNRPTNTGGCGWDIGGRIDMVYGTDWRYGQGWGLENRINSDDNLYGLVLPQVYGEVAVNDLTVRAGRFAGLLCYEQVPCVANFFYSHSYTMCYTEPQLVTGAMADYKLSREWSVQAGFHRGWYMWEDVNAHNDFMGGVRWVSPDQRTKISYHVTNGNQSNLAQLPDMGNWFAYSLLFERQLSSRTRYALQHNYGHANRAVPGGDAEWYTLNQYLFYKINPRWEAGMRFEWMRDEQGFKVAGVASNPDFAGVRSWDGIGYAGDFYEVTLGLNYRPSKNWVFRPEVRWDWYDGAQSWAQSNLPFDDGTQASQFTFAIDAILSF